MDSHITVEALKRNPLTELSFVRDITKERPGATATDIFKELGRQFAGNAHITPNNTNLLPQDDDDELFTKPVLDTEQEVLPSAIIAQSIFAKAKRKVQVPVTSDDHLDSQLVLEGERFSLTDILNSGKMMRLKLDLDRLPDKAITLEEFIYIMKGIAAETNPRLDMDMVVSSLVEAFYRIDVQRTGRVTFDMVSSFIIDQELAADMSKERAILYHPSEVVDSSHHDNFIERLFYFPALDKIAIAEQNVKTLKLYDAASLTYTSSLLCKTQVLAAEYIPDFEVFAVACADKTLNFFDSASGRVERAFTTPDSQHSLLWSPTYELLFSAGMLGKVYGWKLDKLLDEEYKDENQTYKDHLAKGMPWPEETPSEMTVEAGETERSLASGSSGKRRDINEMRSSVNSSRRKETKLPGKLTPVQRENVCIVHLIELGPIQQLAAASFDKTIKLWDIKFTNNPSPRKVLVGHSKTVRRLSYSAAYNLLISCAFDFEVMVWNPYVSVPIARLTGHEAPLVGVECSSSHPTFLTVDTKGVVKLWDIRDFKVLQSFYVPNVLEVRVMKTVPKHYRLVVGARKLLAFDYERPFIPELSDDAPIFSTCFSPSQLLFFIAGNRSIKVWNAATGRPMRILADLGSTEITTLCLDETSRKIIVGDHAGKIAMFDPMSGVLLKTFRAHLQETSGLCYVGADHTLISCSWDRSIVIHNDTADIGVTGKPREIFRVIKEAHSSDILCMTYFPALDLIVTGSRDCTARLWNYETCKLEGILMGHSSDIVCVRFLEPYPLLLVSDANGVLSIWKVKCADTEPAAACLVKWNNMHTLERTSSVTALSHCNLEGRLLIILGDEKGDLRILNVTAILTELQLKEATLIRSKPRNPTRLVEVTIDVSSKSTNARSAQGGDAFIPCHPRLDDHVVVQIAQWKAHTEAIKTLHYVEETVEPVLFTAGLDQMARLWSLSGELKGTLKQGQAKTKWDFALRQEPQARRTNVAQTTIQRLPGALGRLETYLAPSTRRSQTPLMSGRRDNSPRLNDEEMLKELTELEEMMPKTEAPRRDSQRSKRSRR